MIAGEESKIRRGMPITGLGYIGSTLAKSAKQAKPVHVYKDMIQNYLQGRTPSTYDYAKEQNWNINYCQGVKWSLYKGLCWFLFLWWWF